jgi:hypothetical protein
MPAELNAAEKRIDDAESDPNGSPRWITVLRAAHPAEAARISLREVSASQVYSESPDKSLCMET